MAARTPRLYVYRIFDGPVTVYVGKGSGPRIDRQKRRFGCDGEILERYPSDDAAFAAERDWIARLRPTDNRCAGGAGGRTSPKPRSREEIRREREYRAFERELDEVGSRRYVARFLLKKLDERNCERWGLSKLDLSRVREVAHGPRC